MNSLLKIIFILISDLNDCKNRYFSLLQYQNEYKVCRDIKINGGYYHITLDYKVNDDGIVSL